MAPVGNENTALLISALAAEPAPEKSDGAIISAATTGPRVAATSVQSLPPLAAQISRKAFRSCAMAQSQSAA